MEDRCAPWTRTASPAGRRTADSGASTPQPYVSTLAYGAHHTAATLPK
jgi:hypothetical protein